MSTDPDEAHAIDIRHGQVAIALAEALQGRDMMHAMIDTVQDGTIALDLWLFHSMPMAEERLLQQWRIAAIKQAARNLINQLGIHDVSLDEVLHAAEDALHYYQHGELPPA